MQNSKISSLVGSAPQARSREEAGLLALDPVPCQGPSGTQLSLLPLHPRSVPPNPLPCSRPPGMARVSGPPRLPRHMYAGARACVHMCLFALSFMGQCPHKSWLEKTTMTKCTR